jgi:hypothetical protein
VSEEASRTDGDAGRDGLVSQLRELEAFVARADAEGDELPPEAVEMMARLREIVHALDGLTASFGQEERTVVREEGGESSVAE